MLIRLILLFTLVPLVELGVLIKLGQIIGAWPTVGLVLLTGVVGGYLARREGFNVLNKIRNKLRRGELPAGELVDGAVVLVSGGLLLTPGILTDVVGLSGLIPLLRRPLKDYAFHRFKKYLEEKGEIHFHGNDNGDDGGSYVDVEEIDRD